jgi:hypothetical protein
MAWDWNEFGKGFKKGLGYVFNPILDAGPAIGGLIGTAFAPGAGTAIGSSIGGLASKMIPRFAEGGSVHDYSPYMYGGNSMGDMNSYYPQQQMGMSYQPVPQYASGGPVQNYAFGGIGLGDIMSMTAPMVAPMLGQMMGGPRR